MSDARSKLIRKNIYFTEATWGMLTEWAYLNGLSPSEEVSELILDADYAKGIRANEMMQTAN